MINFNLKDNNGFSLIEVIIACAIISFVVFGLVSISTKSIQISNQSLRQSQTVLLIEEGVEAVKSIRDDGWGNISSFSNDLEYYLFFNTTTNKWNLFDSDNPQNGYIPIYPIDSIFTRKVIFGEVYRDSTTDDISSSGYLDENTKSVSIIVSFDGHNGQIIKSLDFYISNIFE